jgi:hypothetical protein
MLAKAIVTRSGVFLVTLLLGGSAVAQSPEDSARLVAFQQKTADYLRNMPNYTCTQRITFFRGSGIGDLFPIGRSEREVAVVYGREMYLERKGREFAAPDVASDLGSGMGSIGEFSGHLRSFFLHRTLALDPKSGKPARVGRRRAWQYDFTLPYNLSEWAVQIGNQRHMLAGRGVLWFDQKSLDLLRLRLVADEEIPPTLPIHHIEVEIDLERKRVGVSDTLLPAKASVQVHAFTRQVQMNQIEFRGCHEFGTDSTIRYDAEEPAEPKAEKPQP